MSEVSMKATHLTKAWCLLAVFTCVGIPLNASAQRDVNWQIDPKGFPGDVSVFIDVEENGVFKRDLTAAAFALSMDEFAGEQGGWILNQQQVTSGWAGAQVLVMIDISRSYTDDFDKAKRVVRAIINYMDPARDTMAIGTAPRKDGFSEANLNVPFTSDKNALLSGLNQIKPLPSNDESGARICNSLSEGLRWFPEQPSDKYRAVMVLTGGADKGEGEGDCVEKSYANGKVPFYSIVFTLDRKYDDPRNAHKIENKTHELSQKTGGRSIFRQSENDYLQFVGLLWNRIRSQYLLRVTFPCYKPMPIIEHVSVLKVEGRDADGIKFQATSAPAPTPEITAIYPQFATRRDIDDGKVELTVDGRGFCGSPGTVKVFVGNASVAPNSQNPFRVVASLNSSVENGNVKVYNRFGQKGESAVKFEVQKPPKGAEASSTLTAIVIAIVVLAGLAILLVALKSRKAKAPTQSSPSTPPAPAMAPAAAPSTGGAAKTMAMNAISRAWIERKDGERVDLDEGVNIIGREDTCRIKLEVPGVSREHARIDLQKAQGLIWLEDLGSTNGTFWGRRGAGEDDLKRVEKKQILSAGDTIWIGGECLTVRFEGGTKAPQEA
jgi:hypothetical protein